MATVASSVIVGSHVRYVNGIGFGPGSLSVPSSAPEWGSLRFWAIGGRHHQLLQNSDQTRRHCRNSEGHQRRTRRVRQRKSWQCFADLEKPDSNAAETTGTVVSSSDCCTDSGAESTAKGDAKEEAVSGGSGQVFETYGPGKRGNKLVALASVTIAVGLFLSGRYASDGPGLPQLAAAAIPYEEVAEVNLFLGTDHKGWLFYQALKNGRPTVVEFYADWCEVCKDTAHDIYQVEQEYRNQINFVMLNVDNSKWESELDEFGVEGIPHFTFLDNRGNEEGNIVGRLPKKILKENLAAMVRGDATVPHSKVVGQFSSAESRQAPPVVGPRSHGQTS